MWWRRFRRRRWSARTGAPSSASWSTSARQAGVRTAKGGATASAPSAATAATWASARLLSLRPRSTLAGSISCSAALLKVCLSARSSFLWCSHVRKFHVTDTWALLSVPSSWKGEDGGGETEREGREARTYTYAHTHTHTHTYTHHKYT